MTSSKRVESADRATRSARGPHTAGHISRGAIWRTRSPGTRAQPDEPTCSSKRHRCQCRVPRWAERRPRHKTGVVSRVPCSFRNASAFGTDRNTYLTNTHQRQRTDTPGQLTDRRMRNPQKPTDGAVGADGPGSSPTTALRRPLRTADTPAVRERRSGSRQRRRWRTPWHGW